MDLGDGVVGPASGAEPVGTREEVHLEDRLQHRQQGGLRHPVPHGGDAQPAALAVRLGESSPPAPGSGGTPGLQIPSQLTGEGLNTAHGLDVVGTFAIHPSRPWAPVGPHRLSGYDRGYEAGRAAGYAEGYAVGVAAASRGERP